MQLPRLYSADRAYLCDLRPSKFTPSIEMFSLGGAKMTLPEGEHVVGFRQWVAHTLPGGQYVVYRVASAPISCGKEQKVDLSHGIVTLDDEVTPEEGVYEGSPRAILAALLGCQRQVRWQIGSAPDTGSYKLEAKSVSVLRALWDALALFDGLAPVYDFTTTPWTVGLAPIGSAAACECRLSRNITGVTINYDDKDFCTRVVHPQLSGGQLIADTAAEWGEVTRALPVASDAPAEEVTAYAQRYLARHKTPAIYAEVDGLELVRQTGEPLDAFAVGTVCRCVLPDYGLTVTEPIVSMRYDDLVGKPDMVRLSLGRKVKDASDKMSKTEQQTHDNAAGVRRGGAGARAADEEIWQLKRWKQVTDTTLNEVGIILDAHTATINLKASQTEVDGLTSRISAAEINIDGANGRIDLCATQTAVDELSATVTSVGIAIDAANGVIESKVDKNGVISAINQTAETTTISASKINLEGYVTASQLQTSLAAIQDAYTQSLSTMELTVRTNFTFGFEQVKKKTISVLKGINQGTQPVTFLVTGSNTNTGLYMDGVETTYTAQGERVVSQLYYSAGSVTVYKRGNAWGGSQLYYRQPYSGAWTAVTETLYHSGGAENYYLCGAAFDGDLYRAGASRTIIEQGAPAALVTETVTALVTQAS